MTKARSSPKLTDAQEARIQAGIAGDLDNPEITEVQFAGMRPAAEALPPVLYASLTRPRGRPKADMTKVPIKLRLDRSAVEAFKAMGAGWQTRMNAAIVSAAKRLGPRSVKEATAARVEPTSLPAALTVAREPKRASRHTTAGGSTKGPTKRA